MAKKNGIRELIVEASEEALNAALTKRKVPADHVISVMLEPGAVLAIGDSGPKYRVIYRT